MGNSVNTIKDFLEWRGPKGETPEEYDFKRNMYEYYQRYGDNVRRKWGDEAYKEFMDGMPYGIEEKSGIEEWLAYKTADVKWPERTRFDCDNSNTTCTLTRLIYVLLWNWGTKDEDKALQPIMAFEDKKYGGDTMNSFATTFNEHMRAVAHNAMFTAKIAKMFSMTGVEFWQEEMGKELWERWNKFARNTQCIGNFVLVPYHFNRYRYGKTKDYWDLSLDLLRNKDGKADSKNRETDQKSPDEANMDNMPIDWSRKDFNRYINLFFLWDYVECKDMDEKGSPRPRWLFDRKREGTLLPQGQMDFQNFLDNVNGRIERRSRFMVAMLKIASGINHDEKAGYKYGGEYQEQWKGWEVSEVYKLFMDKVFLQNEVYDGYKEVISRMGSVADHALKCKETLEAQRLHAILGELSVLYEV